MGSAYSNWEEFTGPIYMGANTSWEVLWFVISAALCLLALIGGARHELDAYKRLKAGDAMVPGQKSDD